MYYTDTNGLVYVGIIHIMSGGEIVGSERIYLVGCNVWPGWSDFSNLFVQDIIIEQGTTAKMTGKAKVRQRAEEYMFAIIFKKLGYKTLCFTGLQQHALIISHLAHLPCFSGRRKKFQIELHHQSWVRLLWVTVKVCQLLGKSLLYILARQASGGNLLSMVIKIVSGW